MLFPGENPIFLPKFIPGPSVLFPSSLAPSMSPPLPFSSLKKKSISLSPSSSPLQGMGLTHSVLRSLEPIMTAVVSEIILHLRLGLENQSIPQDHSPRTEVFFQYWLTRSVVPILPHLQSFLAFWDTNAASMLFVLNLHVHVYSSISQVTVPEILASKYVFPIERLILWPKDSETISQDILPWTCVCVIGRYSFDFC